MVFLAPILLAIMCLAVLWKYPINGKVIKENNKSPKKVNFNNDLV
jgi:hypothetical protein